MLLLLPLVLGIEEQWAAESSWTDPYIDFCQQAASNSTIFAYFKRDLRYQQVLEQAIPEHGMLYLAHVARNTPWMAAPALLAAFRANDAIGGGYRIEYGRYGWLSPSTARYMSDASNL